MVFTLNLLLICLLVTSINATVSTGCPSGCKCSDTNTAAFCCLSPADRGGLGTVEQEPVTKQQFCQRDTNSVYHWPDITSCLRTWRQLKIQLIQSSWPHIRRHPVEHSISCTEHLERLVIAGSSGSDDGFFELHSSTLRNLLFQSVGTLRLRHLTVQQTQLRKIQSGFIDELRATQLLDCEIRNNPQLTSDGLGVGWLANAPQLRLLDLSRNKLSTIDLARWGFALFNSSALIILDLSGNQIAHLKSKAFIRIPNLLRLDLSNNLLDSLPLSVFIGLQRLKILNLKGNRLTVPGLKFVSLTLLDVLPDLRQLQLSENPLLTADSTNDEQWWLNGVCPKNLTRVSLEKLTYWQTITPGIRLMLPPIAWSRCPSLAHLILTPAHYVPCLPQHWLGLPPNAEAIPDGLRIQPSSFQICPPSTMISTISSLPTSHHPFIHPAVFTPRPATANAVFLFKPSTLSSSKDGSLLPTELWTATKDNSLDISDSRTFRILRLQNVGLNTWILFVLLFALFFVVVSLLVWGGLYCVRRHRRRFKSRKRVCSPNNQYDSHAGLCSKYASVTAYPPDTCFYPVTLIPPSNTAYRSTDLSVNKDDLDYLCSSYQLTHANTRLLSPSDSGMGDVTPFTVQHSELSPSSSHASVRLSRTVQMPHRVMRHDPMCYHVPSFTSLRSAHLPSRMPNPNCFMYRSNLLTPQKLPQATLSTEDVSMGPSSTFGDPVDDCGTLSERTTSRTNDPRDKAVA
ncbi:hypothetical protein P879_06838 [Paragonimus westermani]|uniref:Uncharacterized protein n=1 Tax=Paragonimus westermani TaxID=34504 RepID=A0A8T0DM51_9TREM|nr:hypothetical protein P879_06838 [Paragonimus westermani]